MQRDDDDYGFDSMEGFEGVPALPQEVELHKSQRSPQGVMMNVAHQAPYGDDRSQRQPLRPSVPTRKMIYCRNCDDLVSLIPDEVRFCRCGQSKGRYIDKVRAEYSGEQCFPVCLDNQGLRMSVKYQPRFGINFDEFRGYCASEVSEKFKRVIW